jgi:hypothetical protein
VLRGYQAQRRKSLLRGLSGRVPAQHRRSAIQKRREEIIAATTAAVVNDFTDRLLVESGDTAKVISDADTAQRLGKILGESVVLK